MSTTYMNLSLPVPSVTSGPTWAENVNTALTTVDSHDHSAGKGTQVPTAGLNINANLTMNSSALTEVKSVNLDSQNSSLPATNVQAIYSVNGDLYYNNNSGTPVQITQGSSITSASSPLVPSGVIWSYGGSSAPTGFLLCDGSAVSRVTYSDLFATIGTVYGAGNGSTTFNLPDLRGRTPIGTGVYTDSVSGSVTRAMGTALGSEKHALTVNEMPQHNHVENAHSHTVTLNGRYGTSSPVGGASWSYDDQVAGTSTATTSSTTGSNQNTGGNSPHNNMQPSLVTNFIIKT